MVRLLNRLWLLAPSAEPLGMTGYFVYDVMSDLAYGGGFDLLKSGKDEQKLLPMIVLGNSLHGLVDAATWIKGIFTLLPASEGFTNVIRFTRGLFEQRYTNVSAPGMAIFSLG